MNFFKQSPRTNETGDGGNPYLNAREEWLERYGSYISRAAQWRAVAFICLGVTTVSMSGNVLQIMQSKIVPYIIEVDKLGNPSVTGRADEISAPSRRLIQAEIARVINDWRTVTADAELQKKMVTRLSYCTADGAKGLLKQWYTENNPYEIAKSGKLVHVEIKGLPLPVSAESYRVEWVETIRSHSGVLLDQQAYEATAAIQILAPTSETVLLHNPGGIYITALSASKVIGAPATTKRETP